MNTGSIGKSGGGFAHMIKQIWDGPEAEEKADETSLEKVESPEKSGPKHEFFGREPEYSALQNNSKSKDNAIVVSKDTVITGDIKSDGSIEMYGTVTGSIHTTGKVKINGKMMNDVQGLDVDLLESTVRGNVSASGTITVDSGSVVVGDIKCGDLVFGGKLKGNIHVMGNVSCKSSAVVLGDIVSTTLTVENGASLQGNVQVSDGSIDSIEIPEDTPAEKSQK